MQYKQRDKDNDNINRQKTIKYNYKSIFYILKKRKIS